MVKRIKLHTNMNDDELEQYLTQALHGLQTYKEPNRKFQDRLSNKIRNENVRQVKSVFKDMIDEIDSVLKENK